jgi:protoporphyrinogen oxidase
MSAVAEENWDVLVLGAGASGLVAAKLLQKQGATRIALIDEYNHVGGNHIDRHIEPFTFDIGTFIFYNNSPFFDHFPELLSIYTPVEINFGRVTPTGDVSFYPLSISKEVLAKGPIEICWTILSLFAARLFRSKPTNAGDFARFWIGDRLFQKSGLSNYMERFYGVKPEAIEISFAEKRMNWISNAASLRRYVKGLWKLNKYSPKARQLVRPRTGFATIYAAARSSLERGGAVFLLGEPIVSITNVANEFTVCTKSQTLRSGRIIGTIPLRTMLSLCRLDDAPQLTSVALASLFFSFKGDRGFPHNILYNFALSGRWKRLTMFSDFYGTADGREYFCVEVNMRSSGDEINQLAEDFITDVQNWSLFKGKCVFEGYQITANAYPVYTAGASEAAQKAITKLRHFGIEAFGRQGGFDYLPSTWATTIVVQNALSNKNASGASASPGTTLVAQSRSGEALKCAAQSRCEG